MFKYGIFQKLLIMEYAAKNTGCAPASAKSDGSLRPYNAIYALKEPMRRGGLVRALKRCGYVIKKGPNGTIVITNPDTGGSIKANPKGDLSKGYRGDLSKSLRRL